MAFAASHLCPVLYNLGHRLVASLARSIVGKLRPRERNPGVLAQHLMANTLCSLIDVTWVATKGS